MRIRIPGGVAMALATAIAVPAGIAATSSPPSPVHSKDDFRSAMRKLWEDHVTWTRLYIVSAIANLPEKDATATRLLQNQTDIGNAIKPFYGDEAGSKLSTLLKDHIVIATELIAAAQANEEAKKTDAAKRWGQNADDLAAFLSGANPKHWPLAEMKQMLHEHLDLTTAEVVAHLQKDWTGSVAAYDKAHEQILKMADQLAEGIQKQFPAKFSD